MLPSSSDSPFLVLWYFYLAFLGVVVAWQILCLLASAILKLRLRQINKTAKTVKAGHSS